MQLLLLPVNPATRHHPPALVLLACVSHGGRAGGDVHPRKKRGQAPTGVLDTAILQKYSSVAEYLQKDRQVRVFFSRLMHARAALLESYAHHCTLASMT
jgi:hypothetical protein